MPGVAQFRLQPGDLGLVGPQRLLEGSDVGEHEAHGLTAADDLVAGTAGRTLDVVAVRVGARHADLRTALDAPRLLGVHRLLRADRAC